MTGFAASLALRRALIAHIGSDATLTSRLAGIYDAPARAQPFPWLDIGGVRTEAWTMKGLAGQRHRLTLRLFSDRPDESDLLDLAECLIGHIDGARLLLEGHVLVLIHFDTLSSLRDFEGIRQARITFLALTHPQVGP